jgi:glycosyltransferase involved in cell wall biosynthesis
MAAPAVSVVLPTCDRREQTRRCVESLLAQSLDSIEVVVVDDGSADGTPDEIEALASAQGDPRVRVIRNARNLGANASRNRGVASSRGPLVAFLDSDCVADPDWLERLVAPFENPSVGAVSGLVEDSAEGNLWELAFRGTHRLPRRGRTSRFVSGNLCVRRSLLEGHAWEEDFTDAAVTAEGRADVAFSGRCDEEGLHLAISAAGWRVLAEPSARVVHDHPYTARAFLRQAWHGGRAAAELVWKYRLPDRLDLAPFALSLLTLVLALPFALVLEAWWARWLPLLALPPLAAGVAAVSWNELANKGKTVGELVRIAPVLTVYYALRLGGYLSRRTGLLLGVGAIERVDPGVLGRDLPRPPASSGIETSPAEVSS